MENRGSMTQAVAYIPAAAEPQPQQVQQSVQSSPQVMPAGPSLLSKIMKTVWTIICFLVFCGFSFFLGWHMKGWHFSAYYEAPNGVKPVISQAATEGPPNAN